MDCSYLLRSTNFGEKIGSGVGGWVRLSNEMGGLGSIITIVGRRITPALGSSLRTK